MQQQKTMGEFTRERFGPNWVYFSRATDRIRARYDKPDCPVVVITPKQQKQLARDYKAEWGKEYDKEHWPMLCALRAALKALEAANIAGQSLYAADVTQQVRDAIKVATGT